jgi:hypothetical protein
VIDFDCRELLGVEGEHFAIRKLLWIEAAFPLLIGISRSPNPQLALARNGTPPCLGI